MPASICDKIVSDVNLFLMTIIKHGPAPNDPNIYLLSS